MSDPYRETTEGEPEAVKELKEMPPATAGRAEKEQPAGPEKPSVAQEQTPPPQTAGPVSAPPSEAASAPTTQTPLSADLENDRQLKILVDLAFSQGIDKAVSAARSSQNPYLIDKFHDTLVDELRQKLIDEGKLKET